MILGLDTAGSRCGVALLDERGHALVVRDPEVGRGHAERLMGLVATVLGEAGASYADLSRVAVSVGPGSFTGLRVGVAAARGLGLALGIPAIGVSTLEALAEPLRDGGPVLVATDARRGEIYLAAYGPADAVLREPATAAVDALLALRAEGLPAVVVGSGAALVAEALEWTGVRIENREGRIDPVCLARIGLRRTPDKSPPRPLYLRGADAKPQAPSGVAVVETGAAAFPSA